MATGIRATSVTVADEPIPLNGVEQAFPTAEPVITPVPALTLALGDLIPDAHNEVVILDGSGHDIAVTTHDAIAAHGIAETHVTVTGLDVSGFAYCTFEGGITVFYPATHRLIVTGDAGPTIS
jgi:hypothetical protein